MGVWWIGEGVGGLLAGTDPNTGLLLIVLAAAFWPLAASGSPLGFSPRHA